MLPKVDECVSPKAASGTSPGGSILPLFFSKIQTSEELAMSSFQFGLDWKNSSFVDMVGLSSETLHSVERFVQ